MHIDAAFVVVMKNPFGLACCQAQPLRQMPSRLHWVRHPKFDAIFTVAPHNEFLLMSEEYFSDLLDNQGFIVDRKGIAPRHLNIMSYTGNLWFASSVLI